MSNTDRLNRKYVAQTFENHIASVRENGIEDLEVKTAEISPDQLHKMASELEANLEANASITEPLNTLINAYLRASDTDLIFITSSPADADISVHGPGCDLDEAIDL